MAPITNRQLAQVGLTLQRMSERGLPGAAELCERFEAQASNSGRRKVLSTARPQLRRWNGWLATAIEMALNR